MKFPEVFTAAQARTVDAIKTRDLAERQAGSTDPLRLKAVSTSVAEFLYMHILRGPARHIAEFGTSAGYSTLHLAHAAQRVGGRVYTLDRAAQKTAMARENVRASGLENHVEFFTGQIEDFIAQLPDQLDFVLLDFGVPSFAPHWPEIRRKMAAGSFLFIDGWDRIERWDSEPDWREFKQALEVDGDFITALLPLEKGHLTAVRLP